MFINIPLRHISQQIKILIDPITRSYILKRRLSLITVVLFYHFYIGDIGKYCSLSSTSTSFTIVSYQKDITPKFLVIRMIQSWAHGMLHALQTNSLLFAEGDDKDASFPMVRCFRVSFWILLFSMYDRTQ